MKYIIQTKSKLLKEFCNTPEGIAIPLLILILPFWGVSWIIRKLWKRKNEM